MNRLPASLLAAAIVGFLSLFLPGPAVSDETGKQIALPFEASVGDRFTLKATSTKTNVRKGAVVSDVTYVTVQDGAVIEASEQGYRFTATLRSHDAEIRVANPNGSDTIGIAAVKAFIGKTQTYRTDEAGLPVALEGWSQLAGEMLAELEKLLPPLLKEKYPQLTDEQLQSATAQSTAAVKSMFLAHTDESAIVFLEPEALVGGVQNLELPLGQAVAGDGVAPTLAADREAKFTAKATLTRYDDVAGEAEITWVTEYDPQALKAAAAPAIEQMLKTAGLKDTALQQKLDEVMATLNMTRVDKGRALIDIATGWAKLVENEKHVLTVGPVTNENRERLVVEMARVE